MGDTMKVQCQKCKDVFDDGMDPEGVLVPYVGLPQAKCQKCITILTKELEGHEDSMSSMQLRVQ